MSMHRMPLRKVLQLMYAAPNLRTSKLREDIRNDLGRQRGEEVGGPDFYTPFWRSAKDHVFGFSDLHVAVAVHIAANSGRRNLYNQLRDGFLLWWNDRRRWTNQPFTETATIKGTYLNATLGVTAKIGNVLCVRDGNGEDHFIYPYFAAEPTLPEEAARVGLWILQQAFPRVPARELRILDVIRGVNYSLESVPLLGDEQSVFERRVGWLVGEWDRLRAMYP